MDVLLAQTGLHFLKTCRISDWTFRGFLIFGRKFAYAQVGRSAPCQLGSKNGGTIARTSLLQRADEMNSDERHDTTVYKVVVNHEEQYSIWPADRDIPLGWRDTSKSGLKAECLAYVKEVWTDMRPLSLRKKMSKDA